MPFLGVNIDHIATVRQARGGVSPDPVEAALICQQAGADSIVAHLREDRRHIVDRDVEQLKRKLKIRFNLEMSIQSEIVDIACRIKPDQATLVPERRQELTTEGGLDVVRYLKEISRVVQRLIKKNIEVSLFIDPFENQLKASRDAGVSIVELHTGCYADAPTASARQRELAKLVKMTAYGLKIGLTVNAGHGLKYHDTRPVAAIPGMHELNIGHSIISRAFFVGLGPAVKEMRQIVRLTRK